MKLKKLDKVGYKWKINLTQDELFLIKTSIQRYLIYTAGSLSDKEIAFELVRFNSNVFDEDEIIDLKSYLDKLSKLLGKLEKALDESNPY